MKNKTQRTQNIYITQKINTTKPNFLNKSKIV